MGSELLKKAFPHLIAILVIFASSVFYFYPQLNGKVVRSGDIVSHKGMSKEVADLRKQGEDPLWTNAMFGGMPVYQIGVNYKGNKIGIIERLYQMGMGRPIGYFIAIMLGCYLMFISLGVNPWLSLVGAIGFGFSSNHLILFEAGHMTKLRVIAQFAPIIAGVMLVFRKKYLLGGLLFAVSMATGIYANHIQMIYYLGLVVAIYVLFEIIQHVKAGEIASLVKAGGILLVGLLLGVATSAGNLLTTYEYSKDTMRGDPILEVSGNTSSSSEVSGLAYDYAMQWSNGTMDLVATMIPGIVGGGSGEMIGPTSATAIAMRNMGRSLNQAPLYWGALPFTSGPAYSGIIFCFLFILGLLIVRGPIKWWLAIGVLLTLLLSMGKNFDMLSRFFFNYVPMYSKFRTPNSIASITNLLIPILGILGLSTLLKNEISKPHAIRSLYIATGIAGGISLFFALLGPTLFDFSSPGDASYQQAGGLVEAFVADRKSLMRSDSLRSFILVVIVAGVLWAYLKDKASKWILFGVLGALVLFDSWSVGKRYLGIDDFVSQSNMNRDYVMRPVDQQIYAAERMTPENISSNPVGRGGYRVLDMSINVFNSSQTSYYHNTIGGYHPAKLQRIQDLIDQHISTGNQAVLNMLNTKYIISRESKLQSNPGANGTAWFVENIKQVTNPNEEIASLKGLNTASDAVILDTEFNNYIGDFDPQKNGSIALTYYKPHYLTYSSNASSEQLAVFSEMWYGPNKGWQAYIDGNPVEHIRANYALRAMRIPAGSHKIEFKFEPKMFYLGESISLVSSILLLLALLGLIGTMFYKSRNSLVSKLLPNLKEKDTLIIEKTKLPPTVSTKGKRKKRTKKK